METCELQKRNGHRAARSVPVAGKPAGLSAGILALLAVCWFLAVSFTAQAAGGLEMSTSYPGQTVKPGDELTFSLDFSNSNAEGGNTALSVTSIPDGWSGYFEGDGTEISNVYVKSGDNEALAAFQVTVPADAAQGVYNITLLAQSGTMSSELMLTLNVSEDSQGGSSLETDYAEQEGAAGTTFTFNTTIQNNTASDQSYSLSSSAPTGWTVTFTPSGETTQVAAVTVEARGSQTVEVTVTPPENVEAGDYTVPISAISASESLSTDLSIGITGTYALSVSTPSGVLSFDANAGRQTSVTVSVANTGNVDLQNVNLTSSAPTDWTVEFSESSISVLEAGTTYEVTAYVTPAEDALSGDYTFTLSASNSEVSSDAEFRVSVKTETVWGIVAVVLIAAAAGGLYLVFRKYGRR
ncbi:MAG TPA: hypothetical protein H9672_03630 [Firmicutes bacterium]|nr:hypothetical protein [Bacillota bacterium]